MDVTLKTTSFGGYDKKAVENYIEDITKDHEKEVADLKENILKLSDTVKNLHTMREVNLNESSTTIDNLKKVNDELQLEITQLRAQMETYKTREDESASRYESISRTLLEARENADALARQTEKDCTELRERTEAECARMSEETNTACEKMVSETTYECETMKAEITAACEKLDAETKSSCQERKESTYAECERIKRETREEMDALRADTEYSCKMMKEQTENECATLRGEAAEECEQMRGTARTEAYNIRMSVKKECESVSEYMAQLMTAVDNVVLAVDETKKVADQGFPEVAS